MYTTTDAIVLSLQPHSDKAHVLHAYTRTGGRINYMVYGLGRKNPRGLYSPLSLLRITADHTPAKPPVLKEATSLPLHPFVPGQQSELYSDSATIYKQTIALFISEVLYNVLRHPMADEPMFDFLIDSINELNAIPEPQNFHLSFLVHFAAKLGFEIPDDHALSVIHLTPYTRAERQQALRSLCSYFEEHVETWQPPKSLDILMEVFD